MNRRVYPRLMVWPVLLGLALLVGPAWGQAVIYVDAGASGAGDGSNWADAFTSVQVGLDAAVDGDQVWVAAGRYVENITLVDGVALYGGFAGDEDPATFDLAERDFGVNETILDGDEAGSVVTVAYLTDEATRVDGFTITNGRAEYGGGLYLSSSSPTIANNTITGNSADWDGGGLHLYNSSPTIVNNTIADNSAYDCGGGLCLDYSSSPTIVSNTIRANYSGNGGGLYLYDSSPTIANNTIVGNSATLSGGGLGLLLSSPMIANTIIAFNSSGVRMTGGSDPVLRHNCVYGNMEYDYFGLDDPTGTDGNISEDPRFADRAYGNWHIQPDSPCVDAGDNDFVFGEFDMDGEPRIQPEGGTVDIGADESDGTDWPAGPYVIVRVSTDGADDNDGSSWALAKRTVQAAIDVASRFGGEVWVAEGSYYERITLTPYAYVYGGFAGTEAERDQRDWVSNVTVLDGEEGGSVVTARGGHYVSALDGFTITNGWAYEGGGLYLYNASPTITNNTITGNEAEYGGGLYLSESSPAITDNTITGNSARSGGGLYLYYSSPTITNNTITGNSARYGGGLYLYYSSPTITNNTITGNSAYYCGGLYLYNSSPTITNNTIADNSALLLAGGLYLYNSSPTITNNTIADNSALLLAGGLYLYNSSPTITNNTITGNSADYDGGGLYLYNYSSPAIVNNTIVGNSATRDGGGLWLDWSYPTIANSTIAGNSAQNGGGLYTAELSYPEIANTIIAFNQSGVYSAGDGAPILRHNCVYGNSEYDYSGLDDPTGTDGNISEDPLFVRTPGPGPDGAWGTEDDELGDVRLSAGSPCIDAGENAYVPEFVTTDLDGNPRFVDGSGDGVATVDIGAYEYQFRPGDLNCDGEVNVFDIDPFVLALTSAFDEPPFAGYLAAYPDCDPLLADVNGDGLVNVFDIDPFVMILTGGGGR